MAIDEQEIQGAIALVKAMLASGQGAPQEPAIPARSVTGRAMPYPDAARDLVKRSLFQQMGDKWKRTAKEDWQEGWDDIYAALTDPFSPMEQAAGPGGMAPRALQGLGGAFQAAWAPVRASIYAPTEQFVETPPRAVGERVGFEGRKNIATGLQAVGEVAPFARGMSRLGLRAARSVKRMRSPDLPVPAELAEKLMELLRGGPRTGPATPQQERALMRTIRGLPRAQQETAKRSKGFLQTKFEQTREPAAIAAAYYDPYDRAIRIGSKRNKMVEGALGEEMQHVLDKEVRGGASALEFLQTPGGQKLGASLLEHGYKPHQLGEEFRASIPMTRESTRGMPYSPATARADVGAEAVQDPAFRDVVLKDYARYHQSARPGMVGRDYPAAMYQIEAQKPTKERAAFAKKRKAARP